MKHHTRNSPIRTAKISMMVKRVKYSGCQRETTSSVTNTESNFFSLQILKATMHSQTQGQKMTRTGSKLFMSHLS